MDLIADGLHKLREAAIQRRDAAAADVVAIDGLLEMVSSDLADLVPVSDVMRRLGLGKSTVYDLITSGQLPARRIGRSVRVPLDAVEAIQRSATTHRPLPSSIPSLPRADGAHRRTTAVR